MIAFKPMTHEVRKRIAIYIKNKRDISDLIEDYEIRGENLAGAIIKRINRIRENISNTNFYNCVIGEDGVVTNFTGSDLRGCNFGGVVFKGTVWFRHADMRNCKFNYAVITDVHCQYADLRNISICEATFKFGSKTWLHAKVERSIFEDLFKYVEADLQP